MKKRMSLILVVCLILAAMPLSLAEESSPRMITTSYQAAMSPMISYETEYDEGVFLRDSGTYSHTLARMSLAMALAAFRPVSLEEDQAGNIIRFLNDAGMENLRMDQYGTGMDENTVGTAIGAKKIGTGSDAFTLVAVAVCGGRYGNEWLSNFKVGNPGDSTELVHHQGFFEAAQKVIQRVIEYTSYYDGRIKIWITGYSRGAAVSNLSAAMLVQMGLTDPGDMFAYSFATPANTLDEEAQSEEYRGLYSITGTFDPVPRVPLALWGYTRYGKTLTLPSAESDSDYGMFYEKAKAWSEEHLGIPFYYSTFVNYTTEKIIDALGAVMPTAWDYVEKLQKKMMELWREKGNMLALIGLIQDVYGETVGSENSLALNFLLEESAWQGLMQWAGKGDLDVSDSHSLAENLGREHFPDCYISLLMANGEEIYDEHRGYCRIAVSYQTTLSIELIPDEITLEKNPRMEITAHGGDSDIWPVISFTGGSIVTLPLDQSYLLSVTGPRDDVEILIFQFWTGDSGLKTEKVALVDMEEDGQQWYCALRPTDQLDLDKLCFYHGSRTVDLDNTDEIYKTTMMDLLFMAGSAGSNLQTVAWILGITVTLLLVTMIFSAIWAFKGRTRRASVTMLILLGVLYILVQLTHNFLPAQGGFRAVFKGMAATVLLMECLLCTLQNRSRRNALMLGGFLCYIINDVLINFDLQWGMMASLLGNLLFIAGFLSDHRISLKKAWIGIVAFAAGLTVLLLYRNHPSVQPYLTEMIVFLTVLCCLLSAASGQNRLIRIGSWLLVLSSVFIFCNLLTGDPWWGYIISMGTYYSSMVTLALGTKDGEKLPRISARGRRRMERHRLKKDRRTVQSSGGTVKHK